MRQPVGPPTTKRKTRPAWGLSGLLALALAEGVEGLPARRGTQEGRKRNEHPLAETTCGWVGSSLSSLARLFYTGLRRD